VATDYYVIDGDKPAGIADYYFRVNDVGRYDRWDDDLGTWVHVPDKDARDYLSRAVEGGDAAPMKRADIAKLLR
jgi:hypothetical protein